ncbi:arylamine N-acetyltransferase [Crossiella sp. SN42]|uniref:arylamine N-acetyltransferase family protein n=1 Tax=Crossiella sp. SN42 TaxID=2944808 RepID=UPI00207C45C3|nr:arylamine N-acetyltransferase [Crossiella sp. SN42]MCO1579838.1 arylamine N-acetyltransferase [Crossiella sp. SN42]
MTSPKPRSANDEWTVDAVDVTAYLTRIGHPPVPAPTVEALRTLHAAHSRSIPFENIDVLLDQHPGVELPGIVAKLVGRRRGGYCYEHGLLFAAVATQLGYQVRRRMSRIDPEKPSFRTHMTLVVTAEGQDFLVDIGFGAGMFQPMPLVAGQVTDQAGWKHRLVQDGPLWVLQKQEAEGWRSLHGFEEQEQRPVDYLVAHHFVATHPRSPFSQQLVAMRLEEGVSHRLVGGQLTVERADGSTETRPVTPAEAVALLPELGIELTETERQLLLDRIS